jgi:hypothetical protein
MAHITSVKSIAYGLVLVYLVHCMEVIILPGLKSKWNKKKHKSLDNDLIILLKEEKNHTFQNILLVVLLLYIYNIHNIIFTCMHNAHIVILVI